MPLIWQQRIALNMLDEGPIGLHGLAFKFTIEVVFFITVTGYLFVPQETQPMPSFELDGRTYETDEDGYLLNLDDWSQPVAGYLAVQEGVEMSENHWEVVNFLREYYEEYKIAPMIRILTKAIGKKLGKDKGNTKYLYDLYPGGPAKQACKIAGLPKPTGCV